MKKLCALVLLCCSMQVYGQLTFVKEIERNNRNSILLSNGNIKFYNTIKNSNGSKILSIELYNEDLSLYKKIDISQIFPFDTTGLDPWLSLKSINDNSNKSHYFTDNLFNLDNKIEFIVNYHASKNINGSYNYNNVIIILNEDGKELQRFTNLNTNYESFGLTYFKYLYLDINNKTQIYSVPGNLPCPTSCSQKAASIAPITQPNEFKEIQVTGFPNPSSVKVTLAYSLPEGTQFGTLRLYKQTGELVKEFKVSNQVDHLELPVSEYNAGTYFYELQAGGSSSGGKKMVVIH